MHGIGRYSLGIAVSSSWLGQHGSSQHHAVHKEEYSRLVPLDLAVLRCQLLAEHSQGWVPGTSLPDSCNLGHLDDLKEDVEQSWGPKSSIRCSIANTSCPAAERLQRHRCIERRRRDRLMSYSCRSGPDTSKCRDWLVSGIYASSALWLRMALLCTHCTYREMYWSAGHGELWISRRPSNTSRLNPRIAAN